MGGTLSSHNPSVIDLVAGSPDENDGDKKDNLEGRDRRLSYRKNYVKLVFIMIGSKILTIKIFHLFN
jgi:hypothetical protein